MEVDSELFHIESNLRDLKIITVIQSIPLEGDRIRKGLYFMLLTNFRFSNSPSIKYKRIILKCIKQQLSRFSLRYYFNSTNEVYSYFKSLFLKIYFTHCI